MTCVWGYLASSCHALWPSSKLNSHFFLLLIKPALPASSPSSWAIVVSPAWDPWEDDLQQPHHPFIATGFLSKAIQKSASDGSHDNICIQSDVTAVWIRRNHIGLTLQPPIIYQPPHLPTIVSPSSPTNLLSAISCHVLRQGDGGHAARLGANHHLQAKRSAAGEF